MTGRDGALLQRWRTRSDRQRVRVIGLVLTVVLGLVAAPAWSALRNACDLCPRTCPMHQHGGGAVATAPSHVRCHGSFDRARAEHRGAPKMARPPCGNHAVVSATVLPPVILASVPPHAIVWISDRPAAVDAPLAVRLSDPPDTPPPIGAA